MPIDALASFTKESLTFEHKTKLVYRKGRGPAVIVMSEIPGITPKVAAFANQVAESGCTVVMPHLFGDDGAPATLNQIRRVIPSVCVSKEFTMFARGQTSPVVSWLRKLAAYEHERCGGPGVGAVGMCLTGGFALAMMLEKSVIAPVLSQPSLPVGLGPLRRRNGAAVDMSPQDFAAVKSRIVADESLCVLALRYTEDPNVPTERFEMLQRELGDQFIGRSFPSTKKTDHSVLTDQLQNEALEEVLTFFRTRLGVTAAN
jgi:dienelactone hydrolase